MRFENVKTYRVQIGNQQIKLIRSRPSDDEFHKHIFFELVYVVHGSAAHYLENDITQIRAGDYFIIDTGTVHCYRDTRDFEIINCLFLPEYIDRALADCPTLSALLSNQVLRFGVPVDIHAADRTLHDTDGSIKRLMLRMEQEFYAKHTGSMELLRCYLTEALVHAVRATEAAEQDRPTHQATTFMANHLREHYAEPFSLNAMSAALGYTPQYLSTLFHKDTGISPQSYVQQLRVQKASQLLLEKKHTISEIAQEVGYTDSKHFTRIFRKHTGLSPRVFRSSNR